MTLDEKFGIPVLFAIMAIVLASFLTSANQYMTVLRFDLLDAPFGEPIKLDYDREIKRDFDGLWRVDLYRAGVWIETARAAGVHTYRTTATLPPADDLDLDWLSYGDPDFANLPCGRYSVAVKWFINPESHLMRRSVEASDDFVVICP